MEAVKIVRFTPPITLEHPYVEHTISIEGIREMVEDKLKVGYKPFIRVRSRAIGIRWKDNILDRLWWFEEWDKKLVLVLDDGAKVILRRDIH